MHDSDIPVDQSSLIHAAKKFIPIPAEAEGGICFGLGGLWAFYRYQQRVDEAFFDVMRLIILGAAMFSESTNIPQGEASAADLTDLKEEYEMLTKKLVGNALVQQKLRSPRRKQTLSNLGWNPYFFFNLNEINDLSVRLRTKIAPCLTETNFVMISILGEGKAHAVALMKQKGNYYFYDSNNPQGEEYCSNLDGVIAEIHYSKVLCFGDRETSFVFTIYDVNKKPPVMELVKALYKLPLGLITSYKLLRQEERLEKHPNAFIKVYVFLKDILQKTLARTDLDLSEVKKLNAEISTCLAPYLKTPAEQASPRRP